MEPLCLRTERQDLKALTITEYYATDRPSDRESVLFDHGFTKHAFCQKRRLVSPAKSGFAASPTG